MSNIHTVTDRTRKTACVATQIPRDLYQRLNEHVVAIGLTKGEYLRDLIERAMNDSQSPQIGVNA